MVDAASWTRGELRRWTGHQWAGWVDGVPFVPARLRRLLWGRHWARVDLTLPPIEAEIATAALERRGWRLVACDTGDPPTLVFAVRVGSGSARANDLANELGVALADARVRSIVRCIVDPDLPRYQQLEEWRSPLPDRPSALRSARPKVVRARLFTPADRPTDVLGPHSVWDTPTAALERVGTTSDRVRTGFVALRKATQEAPGGVALTSIAGLILIAAVVATQVGWPRDAARQQSYLWLHDHRFFLLLFAAAVLAGVVARQSEGTTRPPVARDQARPSTSAKR